MKNDHSGAKSTHNREASLEVEGEEWETIQKIPNIMKKHNMLSCVLFDYLRETRLRHIGLVSGDFTAHPSFLIENP